jgi:hypothetical protein
MTHKPKSISGAERNPRSPGEYGDDELDSIPIHMHSDFRWIIWPRLGLTSINFPFRIIAFA